jgi:hypothetical protein
LWALAPGRVIAHRNIDGTEGQLCTDKVHLTSEICNVYFIMLGLHWTPIVAIVTISENRDERGGSWDRIVVILGELFWNLIES